MNRYQIEIDTDLNSTPEDRAAIMREYCGPGEYRIVDAELVDADTRPKHRTETWLVTFDTDREFTPEEAEEAGVTSA